MSPTPDDRKERVITARVPEALDDAIRRRATSLGLSVSNLVRNVLQNSLGLVEDIVADSAQIARLARGERQRRARRTKRSWQVRRCRLHASSAGRWCGSR